MIPNSTQIPNNLFNGEMQKMKDTELRVVLLVARKTLGWISNIETGMRKEEDWIAHHQLKKFTGRTSRALSTAIDNCIKRGWIEARNEKGELLDTKEKRAGKKIFYRLGRIFLDKVEIAETSEKSKDVDQTSEKSSIEKSSIEKSKAYKTNTITKETLIQKIGLDKPTTRKDITFKNDDYKQVIDAYQRLKGITLQGEEFKPVQQAVKTMFMSKRTSEQIIDFMEWLAGKAASDEKEWIWTKNWTIKTTQLKLPEFISGILEKEEEVKIPEYVKAKK